MLRGGGRIFKIIVFPPPDDTRGGRTQNFGENLHGWHGAVSEMNGVICARRWLISLKGVEFDAEYIRQANGYGRRGKSIVFVLDRAVSGNDEHAALFDKPEKASS